jgi:hypothetical protein
MTQQEIENHKSGLTKENFFDDLYAKYPLGLQVFCNWIDGYKKAVGWTDFIPNAKFHDLPNAIQEGIYWAFIRERGGCQFEIDDMFAFDFVKEFTELVQMLQQEEEFEREY